MITLIYLSRLTLWIHFASLLLFRYLLFTIMYFLDHSQTIIYIFSLFVYAQIDIDFLFRY